MRISRKCCGKPVFRLGHVGKTTYYQCLECMTMFVRKDGLKRIVRIRKDKC